jgi:hypothetical protein
MLKMVESKAKKAPGAYDKFEAIVRIAQELEGLEGLTAEGSNNTDLRITDRTENGSVTGYQNKTNYCLFGKDNGDDGEIWSIVIKKRPKKK